MNEKYLKKLIKLVEESNIESLEVKSWGRTVKITHRGVNTGNGQNPTSVVMNPVVHTAPAVSAESHATAAPAPAEAAPKADTSKLVPVTSPMVGTFYSSPAPDADLYVSLNEKIRVGQVVCIVEAMKLMNEIESEVSGRIAEILVENGKPVEFGQTMFLIEPE